MVQVKLDIEKCEGCATCVSVCPTKVFEMQGNKAAVVDNNSCIVCGACEPQCQGACIEIVA